MRTPDSTRYLRNALHLAPGLVRPSGYSFLLWALKPFHSLMAVVAVQYLMGLAVGVLGYLLLRRLGLPSWGAALAMAPVLLSAYAIQLEHFLLSDTLFEILVMAATALILWRQDPPVWVCAVVGLLLAGAALTRSEGTPLLIVFLVYLVVRFARWRTVAQIAAMGIAFAAPVAGYAAWFDHVHGSFELTSSSGAFLYGGVATFADCAQINPPAAERQLCLRQPARDRLWPDYYTFAGPIGTIPGGPFGQRADKLGSSFALAAIRAQPLDYLRTAAGTFWENFLPPPSIHSASAAQRNRATHVLEYMFPATRPTLPNSGIARVFSNYDPAGPRLRVVQPFAGWIRFYQRFFVVTGPLIGVIVLIGLGGIIAAWRRLGGTALLPWLVGICLIATPAAIAEAYPRYLVGDVAPLCLAAALGVQQVVAAAQRRGGRHRSRPAG